jgi:SET domain
MQTNPIATSGATEYRVISTHAVAEVRKNLNTDQNALVTLKSFNPGDVFHRFSPSAILHNPTYLTVQTGTKEHITLQPDFLQYINHSCKPNVFFDTTEMQVIVLRPLEPGDEVTFFYPSTEWDMTQSFKCYCGEDCCIDEIKGAAWLSEHTVKQYRFTDYIREQFQKRMQEARA